MANLTETNGLRNEIRQPIHSLQSCEDIRNVQCVKNHDDQIFHPQKKGGIKIRESKRALMIHE